MSENKNDENKEHKIIPQQPEEEKYEGKLYAYIGMGLTAAGALFFGLSFTVMGIYSLIASVIFHIAALTFYNVQKKKNNFKWLFYVQIAAYVLFFVTFLFFAGGILWSAEK